MSHKQETVILLHGIGHCKWNMFFLERALKARGYKTLNFTYPSMNKEIKSLSEWLKDKLEAKKVWEVSDKVHFVAHSMGGLVGGFYLQDYKKDIPQEKMGRFVMLGTPHNGSEVADGLQNIWLYKKVFGPAGQQLTTDKREKKILNKPYYELGIVAGSRHWLYPLSWIFMDGENDGCVSTTSARLNGMKDYIIMPVMHGFMAWKPSVHKQVIRFLDQGAFKHAD